MFEHASFRAGEARPLGVGSNTTPAGQKSGKPKRERYKQIKGFTCPECNESLKKDKNENFICKKCGFELDRTPPTPCEFLGLDWITATFKHDRVLNDLLKIKPLEASDIKAGQNEDHETNDYIDLGLKSSPVSIPFWKRTYRWFHGATVSIGSIGGKAKKAKDKYVMIKLTGQALSHLRKTFDMKDLDLLKLLYSHMLEYETKEREGKKYRALKTKMIKSQRQEKGKMVPYDQEVIDYSGSFSRVDWCIDQIPEGNKKGIIDNAKKHLLNGCFTSTFDRKKTAPKMFTKLDYQEKNGYEKPIEKTETINLGKRSSESFGRIYDKIEDLKAKGYKIPEHRWERFEMEFKGSRSLGSVELALEAFRNGENYRKAVLGLFLKFIRFRDVKQSQNKKRIKDAGTAKWYINFLDNCKQSKIVRPEAEKKGRLDHRQSAIEQCSKRIFKIMLAENAQHGGFSLNKFFGEMVEQGIQGFDVTDYCQIFDHLEDVGLWESDFNEVGKMAYFDEELKFLRESMKAEEMTDLAGFNNYGGR